MLTIGVLLPARSNAGLPFDCSKGRYTTFFKKSSIHNFRLYLLSLGKKLEEVKIVPSMGRVGSALDNAISESFVSTLKCEIGASRYPTRQAARASVFEFIELFYNRERRHSSLGYLNPAEYEQATMEEVAVA